MKDSWQLAHCDRRPNVGDTIEHLMNVLVLGMIFLNLGHVEYVPDALL